MVKIRYSECSGWSSPGPYTLACWFTAPYDSSFLPRLFIVRSLCLLLSPSPPTPYVLLNICSCLLLMHCIWIGPLFSSNKQTENAAFWVFLWITKYSIGRLVVLHTHTTTTKKTKTIIYISSVSVKKKCGYWYKQQTCGILLIGVFIVVYIKIAVAFFSFVGGVLVGDFFFWIEGGVAGTTLIFLLEICQVGDKAKMMPCTFCMLMGEGGSSVFFLDTILLMVGASSHLWTKGKKWLLHCVIANIRFSQFSSVQDSN